MQLQEQDDTAVSASGAAAVAELEPGSDGHMNMDMEEQKKEEKKLMIDWMTGIRQRDGRVTTTAATTTGGEEVVDEWFRGTALGPPMDVGKVVVEGGDAIKWKIGNE